MKARPGRRFAFRLAAHLGMTVRELLARVDARELVEWQVFERIEGPLGGRRGDVHAAMGVAATVNVNRKRKRPYPISDFMPPWGDESRREQTPEEMAAAVMRVNTALGGEVVAAQ